MIEEPRTQDLQDALYRAKNAYARGESEAHAVKRLRKLRHAKQHWTTSDELALRASIDALLGTPA